MRERARPRNGFSLIELIIGVVLSGIVISAASSMILSQARAMERVDESTRQLDDARAALDLISSEIADITRGGVIAAAADSMSLRLPVTWGVVCGEIEKQKKSKAKVKEPKGPSTAATAIYLEPVSRGVGTITPNGFALSENGTDWTFYPVASWTNLAIASSASAVEPCLDDNVTGAEFKSFPSMVTIVGHIPNERTLMLGYVNVTYALRSDNLVSGSKAIFRSSASGLQRLAGPFTADAAFAYRLSDGTQTSAPSAAQLSTVRWINVRFPLIARNKRFAEQSLLSQEWIPLYNSRQ